jgi:hypothetical protein
MRLIASAALSTILCCATFGAAQDNSTNPSGVGWVGLYNSELLQWLENENNISTLCASDVPDSGTCRDRMLRPKVSRFQLRAAPNKRAAGAGTLIVEATPGKGLRASYAPPTGGGALVPLPPDLFDSDWGYGPFFEYSVVEQRGTWVRLAEVPVGRQTWLDITDLGVDNRILWLQPGDIVESPRGDLYILAVVNGRVRARPEQERDMWCEGGPQPPVAPFRALWLEHSDVRTPTGHIRLRLKYTRGC